MDDLRPVDIVVRVRVACGEKLSDGEARVAAGRASDLLTGWVRDGHWSGVDGELFTILRPSAPTDLMPQLVPSLSSLRRGVGRVLASLD
jgi:hypothetical protein